MTAPALPQERWSSPLCWGILRMNLQEGTNEQSSNLGYNGVARPAQKHYPSFFRRRERKERIAFLPQSSQLRGKPIRKTSEKAGFSTRRGHPAPLTVLAGDKDASWALPGRRQPPGIFGPFAMVASLSPL